MDADGFHRKSGFYFQTEIDQEQTYFSVIGRLVTEKYVLFFSSACLTQAYEKTYSSARSVIIEHAFFLENTLGS